MKPSKVIVSTNKEYSDEYEYILGELFERKIELFCAWGKYCEQWELAMDLFVTDPKRYDIKHHITTMSHVDEPFDEVLDMAKNWVTSSDNSEVEILKI